MLGRAVNDTVRRMGPAYPWGNVLPYLQAFDLSIVNLECVIAASETPWAPDSKSFHFRADPIAIESLQLAGIDCVTIANNHILDYGQEALAEMLTRFDAVGIRHAGAGRNLAEAQRAAILEAQGITVAVIASTDNEPQWLATVDEPGTNWIPVLPEDQVVTSIRAGIERCRRAGAGLVVYSNHWGPNMTERPSARFREFARAVIDAGADVYFGHSAHVFQGIEIYRGKPILYDAGDFVDDYAVDPRLRNDQGLLFRLEIAATRVERVELIPLIIRRCQVNIADGEERWAIGERIRRLSAEFGAEVTWRDSTLEVSCSQPNPEYSHA